MVTCVAAEIPLETVTDLTLGRIWRVGQQISRAHNHAGRAIAALSAVHLLETLLERVQMPDLADAFNRRNL